MNDYLNGIHILLVVSMSILMSDLDDLSGNFAPSLAGCIGKIALLELVMSSVHDFRQMVV